MARIVLDIVDLRMTSMQTILVTIMEAKYVETTGMDLNVMSTALQPEEDINTTTVLPMELKCVMSITMATIVQHIASPRMTLFQALHVRRMVVSCVLKIGVVKVATSLAIILSLMRALPLLF